MKNKTPNQAALVSKVSKSLSELMAAIAKENEVLEIGEVSSVQVALDEKVSCLQKFNDVQLELESYVINGGQFDKGTPAMIKLEKKFVEFNELTRRNEILIRSNLEVSNTIIEMYKKGKTQETLRQFGYNKDGTISVSGSVEKVMPSIGLNNKV